MASALTEKIKQVEGRAFQLLAVLYPDADMEQISVGIQDASAGEAARRRGNAVELLDNLLERTLKARFLPLIEEQPRAERLKAVAELYPAPTVPAETMLRELAKDEAAWVRACATWALSESSQDEAARDLVLSASIADPNPVVREIGLVALNRKSPTLAGPHMEARLKDDAPLVRRHAAVLIAAASAAS